MHSAHYGDDEGAEEVTPTRLLLQIHEVADRGRQAKDALKRRAIGSVKTTNSTALLSKGLWSTIWNEEIPAGREACQSGGDQTREPVRCYRERPTCFFSPFRENLVGLFGTFSGLSLPP